MTKDDIADGLDPARGQEQGFYRVLAKPFAPSIAPPPESRPQVLKTLQGEEVGPQRYDHEVRSNECSTIDCTEVGAEVEKDDVSPMLLTCILHESPEGRRDAKGARITPEAFRPDLRKVILECGQSHIAED